MNSTLVKLVVGCCRFVGPSTELVIFKFEGFEIGRQLVVEVQSRILAMSLPSKPKGNSTTNVKNEPITAKLVLSSDRVILY